MEKKLPLTRDHSIDILRGIAIFIMLGANVVGYVSNPESHPLWLRFYGSFAAPLFILLAGIFVAHNSKLKNYKFNKYLLRALMVIITAVLIDVLIWKIFPFTTFDVLYIIGFSIPLVFFFHKIKSIFVKTGIIFFVFTISPMLQKIFGYTDYPTEISVIDGSLSFSPVNQTGIFTHFFVDGWFPVFPWLGFALLGSVVAELRFGEKKLNRAALAFPGILFLAAGLFLYFFVSKEEILPSREAYNEIFYPPTYAYLCMAVGVICCLFTLIDSTRNFMIYYIFRVMGTTSMFIYILHTALIGCLVIPMVSRDENGNPAGSLNDSLQVYLLLLSACFFPSLVLYLINSKYRIRNFFYNFYFGS